MNVCRIVIIAGRICLNCKDIFFQRSYRDGINGKKNDRKENTVKQKTKVVNIQKQDTLCCHMAAGRKCCQISDGLEILGQRINGGTGRIKKKFSNISIGNSNLFPVFFRHKYENGNIK